MEAWRLNQCYNNDIYVNVMLISYSEYMIHVTDVENVLFKSILHYK